ncbi:MAG: hypothetical protein H6719_25540 [Sandaracinaceae bacterium]|nr:hypothetical protein [Sandaracinaceae bacterium]
MRYAVLITLLLTGCAEMHGRGDDGGTPSDAAGCGVAPGFYCLSACGSDAGAIPMCVGDTWSCPPSAPVDSRTCPPGCTGAPPPGCVCSGTSWVCDDPVCPPDINPWDPADLASVCHVEGSTCSRGGPDQCGSALFCTCESGRYNCAVAEPDPVCWCGREPSVGDRCVEEGTSCGQCCPTADGPNWPAMECVDGHWAPAACPELVCPPIVEECPVDTSSVVGGACGIETQVCGNPCCDGAITCSGGVWVPGPFAACACEPSFECGPGTCTAYQACRSRCGPDDGIENHCVPMPDGCRDCSCVPVPDGYTCTMVDGHPHLSDGLGCG